MDKRFFIARTDLPGLVISHGPYASEEVALAAAQMLPAGSYALHESSDAKTFTIPERVIAFDK